MKRLLLVVALLAVPGSVCAQDRAWWDTLPAAAPPANVPFTRQSIHIPMRDGVRMAIDVYLPSGAAKVPTIVEQTRYRRSMQFVDSARNANAGPGSGLMTFLRAGYAVVMADVRGTGASFGSRTVELGPTEVRDGWDLLEWITAQPWSDGNVGATGVSYPGTTAELMGTLGHPALKAIAPRFSLYDFYPDVMFPGGIFLQPFFRAWGGMVAQMDGGTMEDPSSPVTGVRYVDGPDGARLLAEAIAEHARNANIWEQTRNLVARDDTSADGLRINGISSHSLYDTLSRRIPIYNYSGWADGGFGYGAIKRFLAQPSRGSRLIMGPWNHGGSSGWYPLAGARRTQFNHLAELRRFFDYHLRGIPTGIENEPAVHYFTTGANTWKAVTGWPVRTTPMTWQLDVSGRLQSAAANGSADRGPPTEVIMEPDTTIGTGLQSRWNTILGGGAVNYAPRPTPASASRQVLAFTSDPLANDLTVTGSPVTHLRATVTGSQPTVFVYLEEVDSAGNGWMVSEGQLDLRHRKISPAPPWYPNPAAHHSYLRRDMLAVVPGEALDAAIELLPVSHRFSRGNRVRVVITGADKDHFRLPPHFEARILTGVSRLVLPVEP